jgi:hypothetical protein
MVATMETAITFDPDGNDATTKKTANGTTTDN